MIRILIADDSPVFQRVLTTCLAEEKGIEIVGIVDNGNDAVEKCRALRPDLVTMDIFMPGINGLEATRRIMKECPTRIIIISSMINSKNLKLTFEAIQAGAVEVIDKPQDVLAGSFETVRNQLVRVIRQSMQAEPAKRFAWTSEESEKRNISNPSVRGREISSRISGEDDTSTPTKRESFAEIDTAIDRSAEIEWEKRTVDESFLPSVIVIGGSTGAPAVIAEILSHLPGDFHVPILVAQHIIKGFAKGMAEWLDSSVALDVKLAEDDAPFRPGQVLFAPDDTHFGIKGARRLFVEKRGRNDIHVPSVDRLFESAASVFKNSALGVILSGMGKDGARGLLEMRRAGALTIAQNERTSVVFGMPKVALQMGAVMKQMNPVEIIQFVTAIDDRIRTPRPSSHPAG